MPKWKRQDETVCMPNTVCCAMAADGEEARLIVAAHNADIDALTEEVDALRAELARVKAESLRVVVDGEAYSMDDVDIWRCVDNMLGLYMYEKELLLCDDGTGLAAPVRLERWEDE